MPTKKPRVTLTLDPNVYQTITRLADLQGRTRSAVVGELLDGIHPPLMRTVALLEAAKEAPGQVRDGLRQTIEDMERELQESLGGTVAQVDWLTGQMRGEGSGGGEEKRSAPARRRLGPDWVPDPHVVTRGSHRGSSGGSTGRKAKRGKGSRGG